MLKTTMTRIILLSRNLQLQTQSLHYRIECFMRMRCMVCMTSAMARRSVLVPQGRSRDQSADDQVSEDNGRSHRSTGSYPAGRAGQHPLPGWSNVLRPSLLLNARAVHLRRAAQPA
eukprot:6236531-Karenia_brevis.AAC.1